MQYNAGINTFLDLKLSDDKRPEEDYNGQSIKGKGVLELCSGRFFILLDTLAEV